MFNTCTFWQMENISHGNVKTEFQGRILGQRELNGFEKRYLREKEDHRCAVTEDGEFLFEENKIPFPLNLNVQGTFWFIKEGPYNGRRYFIEPTLMCLVKHKARALRNSFMKRWNNKFGQ